MRIDQIQTLCFKCGKRTQLVAGHKVGKCCHAINGPCGRCHQRQQSKVAA